MECPLFVDLTPYLAFALSANYPEFPGTSFLLQLALRIDVANVLADGAYILVKQLLLMAIDWHSRFQFKVSVFHCPCISLKHHYIGKWTGGARSASGFGEIHRGLSLFWELGLRKSLEPPPLETFADLVPPAYAVRLRL